MHTVQDWLIFFLGSFYAGFTFFCVICLLGRIIFRGKIRSELVNIHSAVNLSFAIGAVIAILSYGYEFYESHRSTSAYEQYAYPETDFNFYDIPFFASLLGGITGLLFFLKKFRSNVIVSLLVLILINADIIVQWITRLWRDYVPSAWETEYPNDGIIIWQILLFGIITWLLFIMLAKRKKLPNPSAWMP